MLPCLCLTQKPIFSRIKMSPQFETCVQFILGSVRGGDTGLCLGPCLAQGEREMHINDGKFETEILHPLHFVAGVRKHGYAGSVPTLGVSHSYAIAPATFRPSNRISSGSRAAPPATHVVARPRGMVRAVALASRAAECGVLRRRRRHGVASSTGRAARTGPHRGESGGPPVRRGFRVISGIG